MMRTVFLDRDGVINQKAPEGDYIKSWEEFRFIPGAVDAIRILNDKGFRVIVVTNQRGIALNRMTRQDVEDIHVRMSHELEKSGARIDAIYYCPHEKGACDCRKPDTGLFMMANRDFPEMSFAGSYLIGDSLSDMKAGRKLSCRCIFVGEASKDTEPFQQADSLYDAVTRIVQTPLISIITITYNSELFLEGAIKSVISQSYPNIEHVIIDGASTDRTVEIIQKYDSRISRWVSEPDEGPSYAFNKGIAMATGDIIGLLQSDDYFEPGAISEIARAFTENPDAGLVYGDIRKVFGDTHDVIMKPPGNPEKVMWRQMPFFVLTSFIRREVFEKHGLFDLSYKIANDYELALRLMKNGVRYLHLDKVITNMRAGGGSDKGYQLRLKETMRIAVRYGHGRVRIYPYYAFKVMESLAGQFLKATGLDFIVNIYRKLFYPWLPPAE